MLIDSKITIDGVDITPYIAYQGVQWSRNDVDGPNAGRTMSGLMVRDRVATKIRLDITCRPLKTDELRTLLNIIYPEFVTVVYEDPMQGMVSKTMYANNNKAQFLQKYEPEETDCQWICGKDPGQPYERWFNISFPLVER